MDKVIRMAEESSKDLSEKKKKDKPVIRKVIGNVQTTEDPNARKPGPPSYEHG